MSMRCCFAPFSVFKSVTVSADCNEKATMLQASEVYENRNSLLQVLSRR